jgi:hypothetical protein
MALFKIDSEAQEKRIFREMLKGIRGFNRLYASGMKVKDFGLFDHEGYYLSAKFYGATETSDYEDIDWQWEGLESFATIIDEDKRMEKWGSIQEQRSSLPWFSKGWLKAARAIFEEDIEPDRRIPIYRSVLNRVMDDPILDKIDFCDGAICAIYDADEFKPVGKRTKNGKWIREKLPTFRRADFGEGLSLVGNKRLDDVKSFVPELMKKGRKKKAEIADEVAWRERFEWDLGKLRKLTGRRKIERADDGDQPGRQLEATRRFVVAWPEDLLAARAVACLGRTALIQRWHGEFPNGSPVIEPVYQSRRARLS